MKAILINPRSKIISEVEFGGNYRDISKLIGASLFTTVSLGDENLHTIFVDDEGLFVEDQCFWKWADYQQPLGGLGLILGTNDEGDSIAVVLTIEEVREKVSWLNIEYVANQPIGGKITHPVYGEMTVIGGVPIFREKKESNNGH